MACLGVEPKLAGLKAQTNQLSYGLTLVFFLHSPFDHFFIVLIAIGKWKPLSCLKGFHIRSIFILSPPSHLSTYLQLLPFHEANDDRSGPNPIKKLSPK